MVKFISQISMVTFLALLAGCAQDETATTQSPPQVDSAYLAKSEPAGAIPVGESRESTKDDDEVVLIGRIGGSASPFVDGIAAFTIVDPKVPSCTDEEGCPTPWDYCCQQNAVKENIATVKIVDPEGTIVSEDARTVLGIKELDLVVVHGKAKRDEQGNLAVMADQVFVK